MFCPPVVVVSLRAQACENGLVFLDYDGDMALWKHVRVIAEEQVDLRPIALDPGRAITQGLRRIDLSEAEEGIEGDTFADVRASDLERDVLNHGRGISLVSTTSNALPGTSCRVWSASLSQCRFGAPVTYQAEPLSATNMP